jgi:hypothetical protein
VAQIDVTRGAGEPIRLAHGGDGNDPDRLGKVLDHAADQRHLLIILLAEIGGIRLDEVKKLGHHRCHTGEMPRPHRAFQLAAQFGHVHHGLHRARIHLGDFWCEKNVDTRLFQQCAVAGEIAGVTGQILIRTELQRVDEDRNHRHVVFRLGLGNESQMADMEKAHGRHEADGFARTAKGSGGIPQFGDGFYKLHGSPPASPIAARRKVLDRTRFAERGQRTHRDYID